MTDGTQELDVIIREMRYRVLEDNGLTVNGLTTIEQEAKQEVIDWHNKQIEEVLDRLEAQSFPQSNTNYIFASALQAERAKLKEVK